jgi:hypothetical protein
MWRTLGICLSLAATPVVAQEVAPAPNGITIPEGYKDWSVLSVTERTDNETLRVVIGNDVAMEAARAGDTNPWPEGTVLGKIVWSQGEHASWPGATVPTEFRAAEFMTKDTGRFVETKGWGYARWLGVDQRPFGENAEFALDCAGCHEPMADNDYVFTRPVLMP